MAVVHVRDVPDEVLAALKRSARLHQRSLQGEVLHLLSQAARQAPPAEALPPILSLLRLAHGVPASDDTCSREDIYGDDDGR